MYADEDVQQRQAPLVFSFDIFDDQTVDAVWGSEVDVITYDHDQLEAAEILLPPFLAAKVNDAIAGGKGLEATGGLLEIIVFVGGTASGTRCHYYEPGRKHCHSTQ